MTASEDGQHDRRHRTMQSCYGLDKPTIVCHIAKIKSGLRMSGSRSCDNLTQQ